MPYLPHLLPESCEGRVEQELRGSDLIAGDLDPTYAGGVCDVPLAFYGPVEIAREQELSDLRLRGIVHALAGWWC